MWKLKISENFKIDNVNGHSVIVDSVSGKICGTADFNEIKMFLWKLSQSREVTKAQMLDETLSSFDISTVLALGEIDYFIKKMKEYGII